MSVHDVRVERWESPRGVHEMAARPVVGAVAELVRGLVGYREAAAQLVRREPAGTGVSLILGVGDPLTVAEDGREPTALGAFVVGPHLRSALTTFAGVQEGVQLDLTARGAMALLQRPLDELTNEVVPVDAVLGPAGTELVEQLAGAPSWSERFAAIDAFLVPHADAPGPAPEVEWLRRQLVARRGDVRIAGLVDEVGWSRRHLTRRFREQLGLSPKAYARLLRFEHATELLERGRPGTSIAAVASAAGYYDQAHLDRDFGAFAGCTPSEHRARGADEVQFVQAAEPAPPVPSVP